MESLFCCPCCKGRLLKDEKRLTCAAGHSFDLARAGYVNLLTGKSGGVHGDNKEMIKARKAFLDEGHYLPLRDALCEMLRDLSPKKLLDIGCGEGFYTKGMKEALPGTLVAGIDISKDALGFAGRRLEGGAELAVASAYDLPFGDGTFDCAALLFSPFAKEEILRVLSKDGVLLMAIPGKRHLWALKSLLYETPYENLLSEFEIEGFSLMAQRHIAYEKTFAGQTLRNLFAMTPYYYRTPKAGVERACATESLKVELEFHLLCYKKL